MNVLEQPLGALARDIAGVTALFHRHGLDFCCGGQRSLRDAATLKGLDPESIAAEIEACRKQPQSDQPDWSEVESAELIEHILNRFHQVHREQLPEMIRLADRVERVHGERSDCPRGLAQHLLSMQDELLMHMEKEEQVLFPLLAGGGNRMVLGPIQVMRREHDDHAEALARLVELCHGLEAPADACNTWRALYRLVSAFRFDLMEHIHLENNILFARPEELHV